MLEGQPPPLTCERCGGFHATEDHPNAKIVTSYAETPRTPTVEDIVAFRKSETTDGRAPEGWDTVAVFAKRFHRSRESIDTLVAPQRLSHPEWFIVRRKQRGGSIAEHIHPDLAAFVERQLQEAPPSGWLPATSFGPSVTKIASVTARVHPNLARPYIAPDGPTKDQLMLYYAPEFIPMLRQWVEEQRRRAFPADTTQAQLEEVFGEPTRSRPSGYTSIPFYWEPFENAAKLNERRDQIVSALVDDLVEDSSRQRRVRGAVGAVIRNLERSRTEDEGG
ncbi:MAG: hypothetical protein V1723_01720 [Candidatus Uhrbacteria bacterium]